MIHLILAIGSLKRMRLPVLELENWCPEVDGERRYGNAAVEGISGTEDSWTKPVGLIGVQKSLPAPVPGFEVNGCAAR